jgi:hypothetical protein
MKKMTLTFFLAATLCSFTFAQHVMDVIEGDFPTPVKSLTHDNRIFVPFESNLKVYAGEAFVDFRMPTIGGRQLRFSGDIFAFRDMCRSLPCTTAWMPGSLDDLPDPVSQR